MWLRGDMATRVHVVCVGDLCVGWRCADDADDTDVADDECFDDCCVCYCLSLCNTTRKRALFALTRAIPSLT